MTSSNFTPHFTPDDSQPATSEREFFSAPAATTAQPMREGSALDILKRALEADVSNEDVVRRVPNRPMITAVYNANIDGEKFQMWQRRCTNRKTDVMDVLKFSATILANQLKSVLVDHNGKQIEVTGEDGQPLNFQNPEFRSMFGADPNMRPDTVQLVRDFYGNDGSLIGVAREVIESAGYGDEVADEFDEDPTQV